MMGAVNSKRLPRKVDPKRRFKVIILKKEFSHSRFVMVDRFTSGPLEMPLLRFCYLLNSLHFHFTYSRSLFCTQSTKINDK